MVDAFGYEDKYLTVVSNTSTCMKSFLMNIKLKNGCVLKTLV